MAGSQDFVLPSAEELAASAAVVSVPLRMRFRGITEREALLIRGPAGWGEFAPFLEYDDAESSRWLSAAVEASWHGWPVPLRQSIPVNATVPAVPAHQVPAVLARFPGARTAKVKVAERGQRLSDDVNRVAAVREVLGDDAGVRVDANGGWNMDQAIEALVALAPYRLEYAEQPVMPVDELARVRRELVRRGIDLPIAADESIRKADDPLRVAELEAADIVIIKVAPLGGVRNALRIAEECGLPAVVSSALDTSVGIRAGIALAAALPHLDYACGLGTVSLLDGDVADPSLVVRNGALPVGELGVKEDLLERFAAAPDRQRWWLERLRRCHAVLAAG
ncbi:o-succinylbenzoate synthase [Saxibacter everestensis]|uniref:o-succinylbenzoate synthase n=2 Tax=Saxibacter everestensis TaxID=2909229 RepID=A0ABY8QZ91_9MICO|nr:o-succinylbenzoate synthase [Brevibacteriaceae bacterium ZFBP1038]